MTTYRYKNYRIHPFVKFGICLVVSFIILFAAWTFVSMDQEWFIKRGPDYNAGRFLFVLCSLMSAIVASVAWESFK